MLYSTSIQLKSHALFNVASTATTPNSSKILQEGCSKMSGTIHLQIHQLSSHKTLATDQHQDLLERIDQELTTIRHRTHPWSPALHEAYLLVHYYWSLKLSKKGQVTPIPTPTPKLNKMFHLKTKPTRHYHPISTSTSCSNATQKMSRRMLQTNAKLI